MTSMKGTVHVRVGEVAKTILGTFHGVRQA